MPPERKQATLSFCQTSRSARTTTAILLSKRMVSLINQTSAPRLERSCVPSPQDWIAVAPSRPGLERIEARFSGHAFDPHRHDTYAIGYTVSGVQSFDYRGAPRHSAAGQVMVLHPDEQHDGHAGSDTGFRYRMLYVEPHLIQQALGHAQGALPFVPDPVSGDPQLVGAVVAALEDVDAPVEDLQFDQIVSSLAQVLSAADPSHPGKRLSPVHLRAVADARAFLDAHAHEAVTSEQLETVTGLDRYQLARHFRASLGTSPYRYLTMRRLDRARCLMRRGEPLSTAAAESGFADQSHMTRQFKKAYGMSPGKWQDLSRDA